MSLSTIRRRFDTPLSAGLHSSGGAAGGSSSAAAAIKRSQTERLRPEPVKSLPAAAVDDDREQRRLRRRTTLIFDEEPSQSQPVGDEPCSPTSLLSFSTRSLMAAGGQTFSDYIYNNLRRKTTALAGGSGGASSAVGGASSMMNLSAVGRGEATKSASAAPGATNMNVPEYSGDSDDVLRRRNGGADAANSSAVARVSSILSSCSSSSTGRRNDLSKPLSRAPPPSSSSVRTPDDSPTLLRQLRHAKEMGYSDAAIMAALEANAEKSDDRSNLEKKRPAFRRFASINAMVDMLNVVQRRLHAERRASTADGDASTSVDRHYHKRASASGSKCSASGGKLLSASTSCLATIPDDVDVPLPASTSVGGWRRYLRKSRPWKSKASSSESSSRTSDEKVAAHPSVELGGVGGRISASTLTLNGLEPSGSAGDDGGGVLSSWRYSAATKPLGRDSATKESPSSTVKSSPSASVSSATSFYASAGPPTTKHSSASSFTDSLEIATDRSAGLVTRSASDNSEAARPSAADTERGSSKRFICGPFIPPCDAKYKQKLASKSSAVQRLLDALECENRRAADAFCRANEELKRQLDASVVDANRLRDALRQRRDEADRQKRGALDAQRRVDAANRRVDEMAKELRARDAEIMRLVNELSAQRRQNDAERRKAEETRRSLDAEITRLIDENASAEAAFRENSALRAELAEKEELLNEIMTASTSVGGGCSSLSSSSGCPAGVTSSAATDSHQHSSSADVSADEELALLRERCALLERENRDLSERHARAATCGVCMDHRREVIFMPCLHFTCCKSCADAMGNCSICRLRIMGRIEFFQ